jgi:hypothetical protein
VGASVVTDTISVVVEPGNSSVTVTGDGVVTVKTIVVGVSDAVTTIVET